MLTFTKQDSTVIAVTFGIALSVPVAVPAFYTSSNITVLEQADPVLPNDKLVGHLAKPNGIGGDDVDAQQRAPEVDCGLPIFGGTRIDRAGRPPVC
jgi:hypothetical protein